MMEPGAYGESLAKLRELVRGADRRVTGKVLRFTVEIPPTDPLVWIARQESARKNYWRSRDGSLEVAGTGNALSPDTTIDEAQRILKNSSPDIRVFGGLRFDLKSARRDSHWQAFGDAHWMIPSVEIRSDQDSYTLSCNILVSEDSQDIVEQLIGKLDQLDFDSTPPDLAVSEIVEEEPHPNRDQWLNQVSACTARLRSNEAVDKIVLARHSRLTFARPVNPWALLLSLREQQPDSYLFAIKIEAATFLGASPERLYRREGIQLETEAVAGTRARLEDEVADQKVAEELVNSHKDKTEHDFVIQSIVERLTPLSQGTVSVRKRQLAPYRQVWHLKSPIESELKPPTTDSDLLASLHPTAAVAGLPRLSALKVIAETEGQDRGWYAGPVGWFGGDSAEFAVAIRSALVVDHYLYLYAGAGLVPESVPESEWDESESKMRIIRDALQAPVIV